MLLVVPADNKTDELTVSRPTSVGTSIINIVVLIDRQLGRLFAGRDLLDRAHSFVQPTSRHRRSVDGWQDFDLVDRRGQPCRPVSPATFLDTQPENDDSLPLIRYEFIVC